MSNAYKVESTDVGDVTHGEGLTKQRCGSLQKLSSDHRDLVAQSCGRCRGEGGTCMVETMHELAGTGPHNQLS